MQGDLIQRNFATKQLHNSEDSVIESLSDNLREIEIDMIVTNRLDWGHLVNADNFSTSHLHNELYEVINNRWDWEKRYLHENYTHALDLASSIAMVTTINIWTIGY